MTPPPMFTKHIFMKANTSGVVDTVAKGDMLQVQLRRDNQEAEWSIVYIIRQLYKKFAQKGFLDEEEAALFASILNAATPKGKCVRGVV